jgi:hypothetical protein
MSVLAGAYDLTGFQPQQVDDPFYNHFKIKSVRF